MLKIYGAHTFNAAKVVMTAEELGMAYEYIELDFSKGEHKSPEHLQRHPLGKVPVIEHRGQFIFESNVICKYLAAAQQASLYPDNLSLRVIVDEWIDLMAHHTGRWLGTCYFQEYVRKVIFNQSPEQGALEEAKGFLETQLPVIDSHLSEKKYIAGDVYTVADIIAFCFFQTHEKTSVEIDGFANISRWYADINQRPSVEATRKHVAT